MNRAGISIAAIVVLGLGGAIWFISSDDGTPNSTEMKEVEFEEFESDRPPSATTHENIASDNKDKRDRVEVRREAKTEAGDRSEPDETTATPKKTANTEVEVLGIEREGESSDREPRPRSENNAAEKENDDQKNGNQEGTDQTAGTTNAENVNQAAANMVDPSEFRQMNGLPNALQKLETPGNFNPNKLPTSPNNADNSGN